LTDLQENVRQNPFRDRRIDAFGDITKEQLIVFIEQKKSYQLAFMNINPQY
jgi:hypothetical protein